MGFDVKNFLTGLEKVAIAIGLMGGLKSAWDLWQTWHPNYDLEIVRSAPITLTYDPKQKDLIFAFGLILNNRGTTSDFIERTNADLHLTNSNPQHFAFGDLDITFKDGSNRIPKQLPIQKENSRPLTCEISAHMTDELRAMFQLHETRRELVVTLFAHGQRSYPVRFAFDFGEDIGTTLFTSSKKEPVTLTFVGSDR